MSTDMQMISVRDVFNDYYQIPNFQREFRWTKKNAEELAEDVREWFYNDENKLKRDMAKALDRPYFLGLMVTCKESSKSGDKFFSLIDAQQRITTLFLLFCAIRRIFLDQGETVPPEVDVLLRTKRTLMNGKESEDFKIMLRYSDDREVLQSLYDGGVIPEKYKEETQNSHKNMLEVYKFFLEFLKRNFKVSRSLTEFALLVIQGVNFVRITTEDHSTATDMFELTNARGLELTKVDLIKNHVFDRTHRRDERKVEDYWERLTRKVLRKEKDPVIFFRYFVASEFTGTQMNEDRLHKWFKGKTDDGRANIELIANDSNMVKTIRTLTKAAEFYAKFLKFQNPSGNPVSHMQNISYLGGTGMRQQNFLFMGARHLNEKLFNALAHYVEKFIFHVLITKQQTNFLETQFPKWAMELRQIRHDDKKAFNAFTQEKFVSYMHSKKSQVHEALNALAQDEVPIKQKQRAKYVLAKFAQHIQKRTNQPLHDLEQLCKGKAYEIVQILDAAGAQEVNDIKEKQFNMLGNLTLLNKDEVGKVQDLPFDERVYEYEKAELLMTQAIVSGQENFSILQGNHWGSDQIVSRQKNLADMGMRIWGA